MARDAAGYVERYQPQGRELRWRVRYQDAKGKWRAETFKVKGDANRRLTEVKGSLNAGKWTDPALGKTITLRDDSPPPLIPCRRRC